MTTHFIALSDLHLGYDNSVLNEPDAQNRLIDIIASLCDGKTDRLILNGDAFEACIPRGAGTYDSLGFPSYMAKCSRSFFSAFLKKIAVENLIIVWGNHDLDLWKKVADVCGVSTFTNNTKGDIQLQQAGNDLSGATPFLDDIIGLDRHKLSSIRAAYPNYTLGRSWPYLTFHHGHFLDDLIIGQDNDAKYAGLQALTGIGRPPVNIHDDETVKSLHDKTTPFVASTWKYNSRVRELQWAMLRRFEDHLECPFFPLGDLPASRLVSHTETFGEAMGKNAEWYANLLIADPTTPTPIGPTASPSYLFLGHDHKGGFKDVMGMDNHPWKIVNTGGWTLDGGSSKIHGHITLWRKGEDQPQIYCAKI